MTPSNPQFFFSGDDDLSFLLEKEQQIGNPSSAESRADAVQSILNLVQYNSLSTLTALVAVNYLDRFTHCFHSHLDKPWMTHLAAVSSLSLAAKLHDTQIPPLSDLQVEDSKYVFDSKTIQRMEILILSTLKWKMHPITAIPFLHCILAKLGFKNGEFLRRSECVLLSAISDSRFSCHLPSALATATMVYVIGVEYEDQLTSILGVNKDKVRCCLGLIKEVLKFPKSAMDVCLSCDTDNSNDSASSSPESM